MMIGWHPINGHEHLSKLWETVKVREALGVAVHRAAVLDTPEQLNNNTRAQRVCMLTEW